MEIVLGILLLFGAFTLGSVTSDNSEPEAHTVHSESVASDHAGRQVIESDDRQKCPKSGSELPYRDLLVPATQLTVPMPSLPDDTNESDGEAGFSWDE
jgi:hypothetical protein